MGSPLSGGGNGGGGLAGGRYLRLPPPEHSCTVYFDQTNYGPVSDKKTEAGSKGGNKMVGTGRFGIGGVVDGVPGGGTDIGGGGDGRERDSNGRLIKWDDAVTIITLGTELKDPLAYDPGLELHHTSMSTLGDHGEQLERERERLY